MNTLDHDYNMPSVEDSREDFVIPDWVEEWNEWWLDNTVSEKFYRFWQAFGGRTPMPLPRKTAA